MDNSNVAEQKTFSSKISVVATEDNARCMCTDQKISDFFPQKTETREQLILIAPFEQHIGYDYTASLFECVDNSRKNIQKVLVEQVKC